MPDEPVPNEAVQNEAAEVGAEATEPLGTIVPTEVRIRRAPKYPTFLILGAAVGALVTLVVTALFPADPAVGFGALFGYFAIYGVPAGIVVGALAAIVLDRTSSRRARRIVMEHTTVDPLPADDEPPADDAPEHTP
jgi:fructose-specific phosphotransferase system IIC component